MFMDKLEFVFYFSGTICMLIFCECWIFFKACCEVILISYTVLCPILLNSYAFL
jgi:hypothetical protein